MSVHDYGAILPPIGERRALNQTKGQTILVFGLKKKGPFDDPTLNAILQATLADDPQSILRACAKRLPNLDAVDAHGFSCLYIALVKDRHHAFEELLKLGANPFTPIHQTESVFMTALALLAPQSTDDIIASPYLMSIVNTSDGVGPDDPSAARAWAQVCEALLHSGISLPTPPSTTGGTPTPDRATLWALTQHLEQNP